MRNLALITAIACAGCGASLQDQATTVQPAGDHRTVEAVLDAWGETAWMPDLGERSLRKCIDEVRSMLQVAIIPDDVMDRGEYCWSYSVPPTNLNACAYDVDDRETIFIRESVGEHGRCTVVGHEFLHVVGRRCGLGWYSHGDHRVWPNSWNGSGGILQMVRPQCPDVELPASVLLRKAQRAACGGDG